MALILNDNNLKSDLYRKMAILSSRSLDNENAKKYGILALETAIKTKDWHLIASSNIMLGNQFFKNNDRGKHINTYLLSQ